MSEDLFPRAPEVEELEEQRDERPRIRVGPDEHRVNNEGAEALARHPEIYRQGQRLVRVHPGPPAVLEGIPQPVVRHMATEMAIYQGFDKRSDAWVQRAPPESHVRFLDAPGTVPARRIGALLEAPGLRPDGSLITQPGYDDPTQAFLVKTCDVPAIDEKPTRDDAVRASQILRLPLVDFEFETPVDVSAFLALVLTLLGRSALGGPPPMWTFDANTRGAGKTLLADLASLTATGRGVPRTTFPSGDESEQRKQITATLQAAPAMSLWDNIVGQFGGAPLDQLLTSEVWTDRRLGHTQAISFPNKTIFMATLNNAQFYGDLGRRTVTVRLVASTSRPEDRSDFKIPDVRAWVKARRGRLIQAALTIFRAYQVAGRPPQGLKPFGSFESWSNLVREPLVWCGLPDPIARAQEFAAVADTGVSALERLVAGLAPIITGRSLSVGEILGTLDREWEAHRELRAALIDLCPVRGGDRLPTTQAVGRLFARYRQTRTAEGRFLESRIDRHTKNSTWTVMGPAVNAVSAVSAPTQGGKDVL